MRSSVYTLFVTHSHLSCAEWKNFRNAVHLCTQDVCVRHVRGKKSTLVHGTVFSIELYTHSALEKLAHLLPTYPRITLVSVKENDTYYHASVLPELVRAHTQVYTQLLAVLHPTCVHSLRTLLYALPLTTDKILSVPHVPLQEK